MIDLDELQLMLEKAAEPEPSGDDSYYIVETFGRMELEQKLDAALRNAAPELIAMARRYQTLRRHVCIVGTEKCAEFHILNVRPTYVAPDAAVELDAVLDAMQEQKP